MMPQIRALGKHDLSRMVEINEQGLPGTGKVTQAEMADLLSLSELDLGAYLDGQLIGFVLCLLPQTRYLSLNYAWFNERYSDFLYVDRIAVASESRSSGVGSLLYQQVVKHASSLECPVAAEVSLRPANPGSMRFHERHGFDTVGVFEQPGKAVTMMLRSSK